jgi:redox-sensitive bicupin YhaK (pirin superfamily)
METVTYRLSGTTAHEDTLGNKGTIGPGEIQWMSAGSGIMHQEMPQRTTGPLAGLQLWINLPRKHKMDTPAYRGVTANSVPVLKQDDGSVIKLIAGKHQGAEGIVHIPADPLYIDVDLPPGTDFTHDTRHDDTVFAQVLDGRGCFDLTGGPAVASPGTPLHAKPEAGNSDLSAGETAVYGPGDRVHIRAGDKGVRFILVSGTPLHEPVAWHGHIVMNTRDEIHEAMADLQRGTFIRTKKVLNEI